MDKNIPQVERICLSVLSDCNLKCKYCYFFDDDKHMPREPPLTIEEIAGILLKIFNYAVEQGLTKTLKINFVGGGETLLSWKEIVGGIRLFRNQTYNHPKYLEVNKKIKFYCVTNGILLTDKIAQEMREIGLKPSISLDGPLFIHDAYRVFPNGKPSYNYVIKSLDILRRNEMPVEINTTITPLLMEHLDEFFNFVIDNKIDEVIFDRLIDEPKDFPHMTYQEFYLAMEKIKAKWEQMNYPFIIGNFKPYFRAINKTPDRVCTLFGSSCGAGVTAFMYMQRVALPCDRLFDRPYWILGTNNDEIYTILENMQKKLKEKESDEVFKRNKAACQKCSLRMDCINDCLIEQTENRDYNCKPRKRFIMTLKKVDLKNLNAKLSQ